MMCILRILTHLPSFVHLVKTKHFKNIYLVYQNRPDCALQVKQNFFASSQVILTLNVLFISSWGTNVISVNYFNYNRGSSTEFLLIIARFANMSFIAFSPVVLAVGHRRLRAFIKSVLWRIISLFG